MDKDILHKEIDLIQACINRMANNSFFLKGWTISIIAVVFALSEKTEHPIFLSVIMLIPLLSFWYLDAFFLRTEKMYRKMYEWVLEKRKIGDTTFLYDLNPHRFKNDVPSSWQVMRSVTLKFFYGIPALLIIVIIGYQVLVF